MTDTVMNDGHMIRVFKVLREKRVSLDRVTKVLASPLFAALFDEQADLSHPEAIIAMLGIPQKREQRARKILDGLLELSGDLIEVAGAERFVASEKFVVDHSGELPISGLGDNFKANFLDKVEEKMKPARLKKRKLLKRSVDEPIIKVLGGEKKVEVMLTHVFTFLKTADRTKHYIFYVCDVNGVLWAVNASWNGYGWCVDAFSVSVPVKWDDGHVVVSR